VTWGRLILQTKKMPFRKYQTQNKLLVPIIRLPEALIQCTSHPAPTQLGKIKECQRRGCFRILIDDRLRGLWDMISHSSATKVISSEAN